MKIQKTFLSFIIVLVSNIIFSQTIQGKITNEENLPIFQAKIGIENEKIGTRTDENGNYKINLDSIDKNKNILITANGYTIQKINLKQFINLNNHSIQLTEKTIEIPEIIVKSKKLIHKNWGSTNTKNSYSYYDSNKKEKKITESSVKFKNHRRIKINKINLGLSKYDFSEPITIIFDIYNSINDFPGESLVNEPLVLKINTTAEIKNNMLSLDISDKNIWINEDFFVSYRVNEDFKGQINISGNIFAFTKDTYYREYYEEWSKFSVGVPAINIDIVLK